jgi:hypothetical protein
MTTPTADYDAAVRALRAQSLPAYVEYTQEADAHGLAGWRGDPERIVVDVRAKKIVSVTPRGDWDSDDSPVIKHIFNPACYVATAERLTNWNGTNAIAISVTPSKTCKEDIDVSTVYADAQTLDLLGTDGTETDDDSMTVDFSVHYARTEGFIVPSSVSAHAHGHGLLFWARERAEIRYSNYSFTSVRRQQADVRVPATGPRVARVVRPSCPMQHDTQPNGNRSRSGDYCANFD